MTLGAESPNIEGMPYRREAEAVLAKWHEIERDLAAVEPTCEAAARLAEEWAPLRMEHMRLTELAHQHGRPVPELWPERENATKPSGALTA